MFRARCAYVACLLIALPAAVASQRPAEAVRQEREQAAREGPRLAETLALKPGVTSARMLQRDLPARRLLPSDTSSRARCQPAGRAHTGRPPRDHGFPAGPGIENPGWSSCRSWRSWRSRLDHRDRGHACRLSASRDDDALAAGRHSRQAVPRDVREALMRALERATNSYWTPFFNKNLRISATTTFS